MGIPHTKSSLIIMWLDFEILYPQIISLTFEILIQNINLRYQFKASALGAAVNITTP